MKGTVIRPLPEWYVRLCATGGYIDNLGGAVYPFIGLYNDATDGSSLWVYSISFNAASGGGSEFWIIEKGPLGTLAGQGTPVVSDVAALPGQIWFGGYASYSTVVRSYQWVNSFITTQQLNLGLPLAVLRPGYQMNLTTSSVGDTVTAGFYWAALPGTAVSSG